MSQCDKHLFYYFHFQFLKYYPLSVMLYSRIFEGSHKVTANVSGLCVRAGFRSTKVDIITNVQLKNYC